MSSHLRAVTKSSFAVHCVYVKLASLVFLLNCLLLICLSAYLLICLLLILLIVRGHSPVISFRYRFVVFCLSFPSLASCFRCLLRGLQFLSSFRSSSLFFACLRSFVSSLHRRRISSCGPLSRIAVFATAPSSVVFILMSGFRLSSSSSSSTSLLAISVLLSIGASSSVSEIFQLFPKWPDPGHSFIGRVALPWQAACGTGFESNALYGIERAST